jgi:hypothetical protein
MGRGNAAHKNSAAAPQRHAIREIRIVFINWERE